MTSKIRIIKPETRHLEGWKRAFLGYNEFYKVTYSEDKANTLWGWLMDPQHVCEALIATTETDEVVAIAHFREMPRPLHAQTAGFLDDLFVVPEYRQHKIGEELITQISEIGRERGWQVVRWLTADNNYRARGLYDQLANRTAWLTYEIKL